MDSYYAIYQVDPLRRVSLPVLEGAGDLFPGKNPFAATATAEVNLTVREGEADVLPGLNPWASNAASAINLSRTEGDASVLPGRNPFAAISSTEENLNATEGDAAVYPGQLEWTSDAGGSISLTRTEGDATVLPGKNAWTSAGAGEENLLHREGDSKVLPGRNPWISLTNGVNLVVTEGDSTVLPGKNEWASEAFGIVNLQSTEGDGTAQPGKNPWVSAATGDVNLDATEGDAAVSPGRNAWASQSATEQNLESTEGDATLLPGRNPWVSSTVGDVNLENTEGDATCLPGRNEWASNALGATNLEHTEGDSKVSPGRNAWVSSAATDVNLEASEGDAAVVPGKNAWSSSAADAINLGASEGDSTVYPGRNGWTSDAAADVNLSATEGDGVAVPGRNPFTADAVDTVNLGVSEGDGTVVPGENPFVTESGPTVQTAVCFSGSFASPAYLATGLFSGPYNPVTYGYVSVYYKYTGTNPVIDFPDNVDNVIFTVWGDTEGDRIEFGVISGDQQNLDLFTKTSGLAGFNKVRAVLGTDIADGEWHHLMFGGGQGSWWFFVDGTRITATLNDFGGNTGEWFADVQGGGNHEVDVAATRVSDAVNGTDYLIGCVDELMVVNNRDWINEPNDPTYLHNNGDGVRIPEVESENQGGLWDDVYNAWRFNSDNVGQEYRDGLFDFNDILGDTPTDGIVGKLPAAAINMIEPSQPRSGLMVDYAVKTIPNHSGSFTLASWVRLDTLTPSADGGVMTKLHGGISEWALYYDAATQLYRARTWTSSQILTAVQPSYIMTANIWYFVALRIGPALGLQVSIGAAFGTLQHGTPGTIAQAVDGSASILLGMYGYNQSLFPGTLDDTMYWTRVLNDGELDQLFDAGNGLSFTQWPGNLRTSLIMHFDMDECCGVRYDSYGANIGTDGKRFAAQPVPSQEPLTVQGHIV